MMVVMLILSIVLAAMAPVMTTRNKPNNSTPWKYDTSVNPSVRNDIWFGTGARQHVMIGQERLLATDPDAKLLINVNNGTSRFLGFKRNGQEIGGLYLNNDGGIMLGSINGILAANSNAIGRKVEASQANATAYGSEVKANGTKSVAVGTSVTASGANSLAIGNTATGSGGTSIAVGSTVTASGSDSLAIGSSSSATDDFSIALGSNVTASDVGAIAVGHHALVYGIGSIAIGAGDDDLPTLAGYHRDVVIGPNSSTKRTSDSALTGDSIAIGGEATTYDATSIAIGPRTTSYSKSIAIGDSATISQGALSNGYKYSSGSIAIGQSSSAKTEYSAVQVHNQQYHWLFCHKEANSIALGSKAVANQGGIAIGSPSIMYISATSAENWKNPLSGGISPTKAEGGIALGNGAVSKLNAVAIGPSTESASNAISIGNEAKALNENTISIGKGANASAENNIAIGANACSNATGSNKICIGTNSGPVKDSKEATSNDEMIFLGSEPKWKTTGYGTGDWARSAVMVIHNVEPVKYEHENRKGNPYGPTVYINGNLVVRGYISGIGRGDDRKEEEAFGILANKNGNLNGDKDTVKWYGHERVATPYWSYYSRYSDRRLKYVGKENTSGLDKIRQLKVFNYTFKKDTKKEPHVGVIAQDLQKIFPNAVKKGADGFLTIRMEDMFYAVINAIKELDAKYQAQEKRINELEKRIEKLEAKVK